MSTLTSADFGELKRPTTRVQAPPGGGSQWSHSNEDTSAPPQPKRRDVNASMHTMQHPTINNPTPVIAAPPAPTVGVAPVGAMLRVAILMSMELREYLEPLVQECGRVLQSSPEIAVEVHTVPTVSALPYAANKLLKFGGCDGLVCFGFVDASVTPVEAHLAQALIDISIQTVKPVVRAFYGASIKSSGMSQENTQQSKDCANNVIQLMRCGGFICRNGTTIAVGSTTEAMADTTHSMSMDLSENESVSSSKANSVAGYSEPARTNSEQGNFRPKFQQPRKKQYGAGESSVFFG